MVFPLRKCSRRIRPIVSTVNIPHLPASNRKRAAHQANLQGVNFGRRSPGSGGQNCTPNNSFGAAQKYYELTSAELAANGGHGAFIGDIGGETVTFPTGFSSFSHDPYGPFGGGQVGCQYQWDKWVIGIEGSGSWARIDGDSGGINLPFQPPASDKQVSFNSRTDWFASVTGKFGYTGGRWLVYSKAGVAWDHTKYFANGFFDNGDNNCNRDFPQTCTLNLSASNTPIGWTTGLGIEFAALPWLTIFLEYNHYDFGRKTLHFDGTYCIESNSSACTRVQTIRGVPLDNKQRIDTIRLGFNILFNWGKAPTPVVARY